MRRIKYLATLFLYLVSVSIIGRVAFLYYNRSLRFFSIGDAAYATLRGLPMDMAVASAIGALAVVLTLLSRRYRGLPMRRMAGVWMWLLLFVAVCITCGDIIMYEHWKFKLDASVFAYMSEPGEMSSSEPVSYLLSRVGLSLLAAFVAGYGAYRITPTNFRPLHPFMLKARMWVLCLAAAVFLAPLFLAVVGVIGEDVAFCEQRKGKQPGVRCDVFMSHAAVNPVFHMVHSMILYARSPREQFRSMDSKEARHIVASLFPADTEDITDTLFTTTRPNILTLQIESMGAVFVKSLDGAYGETAGLMSDTLETVTPELCRWMRRGLNFTRAYATSFRTDRGTVSVLSGCVSFPTVSLMMQDSVLSAMEHGGGLPGLPATLRQAGYSTCYLYGGDPSFMNKGRYLRAAGYDSVMGIEDIGVDARERDNWGANDSIAFERLYTHLMRRGTEIPWCVGFQTMSSHEPWQVPYERLRDKIPNAFAYTDHHLGRFLTRLRRSPLWENTIVVIFADHGYPYHQFYDRPDFFHIPLLIVGGALTHIRTYAHLVSQSDIAATLLSQMGIPHRQYPWSRNVFSKHYTSPCVYATYPSGAVLLDDGGYSIYDHQSGVFTTQPDEQREKQLKAILQESYDRL